MLRELQASLIRVDTLAVKDRMQIGCHERQMRVTEDDLGWRGFASHLAFK